MAESDWSTELARFGYEFQQKFDFYLVALTFTILGLALQTATFGTYPVADVFELVGWVALLVSGIAGIHRLEWQPQVFQLRGVEVGQETRLAGLRKARAQGTKTIHTLDTGSDVAVDKLIADDEAGLELVKSRIKTVEERATLGYKVRSVAFLAGMVCLMIARGTAPVLHIVTIVRTSAA